MSDEKIKAITERLQQLSGEKVQPQTLSENEKKELIQKTGPKTLQNILKAKKSFPLSRIPFLFNTIDTQDVINILHNTWDNRLFEKKKP